MDEASWRACSDPLPMIEYLWGKASDRKARLLMCACCRQVWSELDDDQVRHAVEVAERFADGQARYNELERAGGAAMLASKYWGGRRGEIAFAAADVISPDNPFSGPCSAYHGPAQLAEDIDSIVGKFACHFLREIFGNPFRTVVLDPGWLSWNHAAVPAIARHVYDDRAFHDMLLLADALVDAGCRDHDILAHCRGDSPHARGCWVVDLILGKS
jgi:hypothetical protein